MAYLVPGDLADPAIRNAHSGEVATLPVLRDRLASNYTVYHGVHWSNGYRSQPVFGEIDFVVVNNAGEVLLIEQKNGPLREDGDGIWKEVGEGAKNPVNQIRRSQVQVLGKFQWIHGERERLSTGVLVFCPEHRVAHLNAVGLDPNRVVDSSEAEGLTDRIQELLPPGPSKPSAHAHRVHDFFRQTFRIVPDLHAHRKAQEQAFTRLTGDLATILERIEMAPLRLRFRGAAGSGKSQVAAHFYDRAVKKGRHPLLVCFNRPLADRFAVNLAEQGGWIGTWHQLVVDFLSERGRSLELDQARSGPGLWDRAFNQVLEETVPESWRFGPVIVDEGQDFKEEWYQVLRLFTAEGADFVWLEDPDQNVRAADEVSLPEFVGFQSPENYRTPSTIARFIQRTLDFAFVPANPIPGLGVTVVPVSDAEEQQRQLAHRIQELVRQGFAKAEIVVLTARGMGSSPLWQRESLGPFRLDRFTGTYDEGGHPVFIEGEIRLETVNRFKGQQASAVLLADVSPREGRIEEDLERIYTGMTRATVKLELFVDPGNPRARRFLNEGEE